MTSPTRAERDRTVRLAEIQQLRADICWKAGRAGRRLDNLLSQRHASVNAKRFGVALAITFHLLETVAEAKAKRSQTTTDVARLKGYLETLIQIAATVESLFADIRYLESARSELLPWSLVPAFERVARQVVPGIRILLRPKWKWNFECYTQPYEDRIRRALVTAGALAEPNSEPSPRLRALAQLVDEEATTATDTVKRVLGRFHIISFPSVERTNPSLHALLAHELGHLVAEAVLVDAVVDTSVQNLSSKIDIEAWAIRRHRQRPDWSTLDAGSETEFDIKTTLKSQLKAIARTAASELIADMVGAIVIGPAALFSSYELALRYEFDIDPLGQRGALYPPWRMWA